MKFVTFRVAGRGVPRAGALVEGGAHVLDLQTAHRARYGRSARGLASVLAIVEGGDDALALARSLVAAKRRPKSALLPREAVRLDAPIPRPPQMRDFLCFEKHLVQAFRAARTLRARSAPDPEAALAEMEAKGILAVPQTWYERPIFYHPNRFSVCGHEDDVPWPAYCQVLDFELEFGCYIGRPGKDIPKEKARSHIFGYTIFNDFSARD